MDKLIIDAQILILNKLRLKDLISFTQISMNYNQLIKTYKWNHIIDVDNINLIKYLLQSYKFDQYIINSHNNIRLDNSNVFTQQHNDWLDNDTLSLFTSIRSLELSECNQITNDNLMLLTQLSKLKIVACNKISIKSIICLTNLRILSIDVPDFKYDLNNIIESLPKLNELFIGIPDDYSFDLLCNLKNIPKLHIRVNGCTTYRNILRFELKKLSNLYSIILKGPRYLDHILSYMNNIQVMDISANPLITDTTLSYLGKLRTLNISYCETITDNGLQYLSNLRDLDISYCPNITDTGLKYLGNVCILLLNGCYKITDIGLEYLVNTERLMMDQCINITNNGLKNLKKIIGLSMYGCYNIDDDGLKHIINISALAIESNNKITIGGLLCLKNLQKLIINNQMNFDYIELSTLPTLHTIYIDNVHYDNTVESLAKFIRTNCKESSKESLQSM